MFAPANIHRRLLTLAIAVAMPLAGLVGFGVYRQFASDREHALHEMEFLQQLNEGLIKRFVEEQRRRFDRLAGDARTRGLDDEAMWRALREIVQNNPVLADIRALDPQGRIVASAQPIDGANLAALDALPEHAAAAQTGSFAVSHTHRDPHSGLWTCLIIQPVTKPDGGRRGTLVAPIRLDELMGQLVLPPNDADLSVGIFDRSGLLVLRSPVLEQFVGRPLTKVMDIAKEAERGRRFAEIPGLKGETRTFVIGSIPHTSWLAVTSVPSAAILRDAYRNLWQTLVVVGIIIALGGYLVVRYSRMMARPVLALAEAARKQAAGQTGHLAPVSGPAEIAETASAFNEMVAARRNAEELLAQSELRYRTAVDQTGQLVYEVDLSNSSIQWFGTEATPAITGFSLAEFQCVDLNRWGEMIHPADRAAVLAEFDRACAEVLSFHADYRFRHRDGTYRDIEDHGVFIKGPDGRAIRMIGRMGDITERRRAASALLESEELYSTVVEQTGQLIYDCNFATGEVRWVGTAAALQILGCTPEEFSRRGVEGWRSRLHPDDAKAAVARFEHSLVTGEPCVAEYRVRHENGAYHLVDERGVVLRDASGVPRRLVGRMIDITERRRAEEERVSLDRKLRETQKLESLGVLAGGIAHDFNNLLTGILGHAGLARLEAPRGWRGAEYLGQIEKASLRAADLCKQMLAYSGKGRFAVQRFSLNELLEETAQLLHISISRKATLQLSLDPTLPGINADPTQIRQVVMNLVINASEALGDQIGQITLRTSQFRADPSYLASMQVTGDFPPGPAVCLEISDTGIGMDRDTVSRIFDPFFTTKFTGRGLGLAAVLGIVRGHSGAIKVYSEPGRGTTFRVLLPAAPGAIQALPQPAAGPADWRGTGTILIIDDESAVREVARHSLAHLGFAVELASDGVEGLTLFRAAPDRYTAVLLDLTMPNMDGEEAFRQLRLLRPEVRVVLMSGFNRVEAINRFVGKGLAGFIQKPFEIDTLARELRRIIETPGAGLERFPG